MNDRQLIADLLSALEYHTEQTRPIQFSKVAIEAAREYLRKPAQQPAQQQPYGWKVYGVNSLFMGEFAESDAKAEAKRIGGTCITFPLYTSPPASKPWQGLTDGERLDAERLSDQQYAHTRGQELRPSWASLFCRAIEAKLREKNA